MNLKHFFLATVLAPLVAACAAEGTAPAVAEPASAVDSEKLAAVLALQPDERKERYGSRHPQETLEFFGIEPGMTVVEVLPGRGWYSPILAAYLGEEGKLVGVDYPLDLWPNFPFATEKFIAGRRDWVNTWPESAAEWPGEGKAPVMATRLDEMPDEMTNSVDAVLFIRALHNLNRFEAKGNFRTVALAESLRVLRPGGIVGVVQHRAPDDAADEWADGSRGYLKQANVIAVFEAAGFEFVAESGINANPRDIPGETDIVWRLPPSLNTSKEKPELRAEYQAIGESNRMTLLFMKPAASASESPGMGVRTAPTE